MDSVEISSKNREQFLSMCNDIKLESSTSIWTPLFTNFEDVHRCCDPNDVRECSLEELENMSVLPQAMDVDEDSKLPQMSESDLSLESFIDEETIFAMKLSLENIIEDQPNEIMHLDVILKLPPPLVSILCDRIGAKDLKDVAVAALLNGSLLADPPISISMASALVRHFVFPKVMDENVGNFRSLGSAIINFSEKYCLAVVEELFIPCMTSHNLGSGQMEMLTRLMSQINQDELICYSLRKLLETAKPDDNLFSILKSLTEKKAKADKLHSFFILKLQEWSAVHNNSLSFTKLVISFISCYGSEVTSELFSILQDIVTNNSTVLKKAAEISLKKAKK